MITELIKRNRSYRRYDESVRIRHEELLKWIDLARLSSSSRNQQALKFLPVVKKEVCVALFNQLAWAGYLQDWQGPVPGERPSAYICILGDHALGSDFDIDLGIAAQSILLGAVESGFGGCMIGSVKKDRVRDLFSIPERLSVLLVIALGKPVEQVVLENCSEDNIKYWRDNHGVHHVPKRSLGDIVV